jgi:DNA-binding MarR family transcriptional regulator
LSAHLSKLEEAGYLEVEKRFKGRRPNTNLRLTAAGRTAFREYRRGLKQMLEDLPE